LVRNPPRVSAGVVVALLSGAASAVAQDAAPSPDRSFVYREIDGRSLRAHVFFPERRDSGTPSTGILLFHGGGWDAGSAEWTFGTARRFAEWGLVGIAVQYRLSRMLTFLSPGGDAQEASWQITQSLIGIGAGEVFGVGFGQGQQKLGYLPYAYSDFIFSTIGEEWGFIGVCLIVLLFAVFIGVGFRIARTAPDAFGMLLAVGLTVLVGAAAVLHMAVTLALVPTTGLPLPFISYGRSSLLVSMLAAGILINIGSGGRRRPDGRGRAAP